MIRRFIAYNRVCRAARETPPALVSTSREGANMAKRTCSVDHCTRPVLARGWCRLHYDRWRTFGSTDDPTRAARKPCSVDGCTTDSDCRGFCNKHYQRWLYHGSTDERPRRPTLEERFWSKVDKTETCWLWTAGRNPHGYGRIQVGGRVGRHVLAHRFAYEAAQGPVPEGLELDHLCRVRHCVRPDHLEAVTHRINMLRSESPSARHAVKTHCLNGHPFEGSNLMATKTGVRQCRTCSYERARQYRLRRAVSKAVTVNLTRGDQ